MLVSWEGVLLASFKCVIQKNSPKYLLLHNSKHLTALENVGKATLYSVLNTKEWGLVIPLLTWRWRYMIHIYIENWVLYPTLNPLPCRFENVFLHLNLPIGFPQYAM